jgi:hypothetical protein
MGFLCEVQPVWGVLGLSMYTDAHGGQIGAQPGPALGSG